MSKNLLVLPTILIFGLLTVTAVFAEQSSPSGVRNKLQERVGDKIVTTKEKTEVTRENKVERVRQSAKARYSVFSKTIERAEELLDKLQIRINKAETAGKDVSKMNDLMKDARVKIADAKAKLIKIEEKKETALNKASFLEIRSEFKAIWQDIHIVRQDATQIIKILKSFNSATSNNQKSATPSAKPSR